MSGIGLKGKARSKAGAGGPRVIEARLELGDDRCLYVSGVVSFDTVPRLSEAAERLFQGLDQISVDLSKVTRADSAGLALMVEWMRQARELELPITYLNIPAQMLAIARVSGLDRVLPLG